MANLPFNKLITIEFFFSWNANGMERTIPSLMDDSTASPSPLFLSILGSFRQLSALNNDMPLSVITLGGKRQEHLNNCSKAQGVVKAALWWPSAEWHRTKRIRASLLHSKVWSNLSFPKPTGFSKEKVWQSSVYQLTNSCTIDTEPKTSPIVLPLMPCAR